MKKRIALLLAGVLAVASLTACGGNGDAGKNDADAKVKVGLGACTSFSESYSKGDNHQGKPAEATNAQVDIHVASVVIGADGKIAQCAIDAIQVKATVDEKGTIAEEAKKTFISKADLGKEYGMEGYSASEGAVFGDGKGGIGKEWNVQASNYASWCEGKTIDEIKAGVGTDEYPVDNTLLSGCTIKIGDMTKAVVNAYETAVEAEISADDVLGIAIIGEMTGITAPVLDAEGKVANDKDGKPQYGKFQAYVNYACTTQNAKGEITSVLIDSIQAYPTWDENGILTTDANQDLRSKYTKKGDYKMQPASSLKNGEWYQQIDVFKQFITGKTADFVKNIAVNESGDNAGKTTDKELITGCTMKIVAYKTVVVKSLEK